MLVLSAVFKAVHGFFIVLPVSGSLCSSQRLMKQWLQVMSLITLQGLCAPRWVSVGVPWTALSWGTQLVLVVRETSNI